MSVRIRPSRRSDDAALAALDHQAWSALADVAPIRSPDAAFFGAGESPEDVLVATRDGLLVGWVKLGHPTPLASNAHVHQVQGIAVRPDMRRQGIARALLAGALNVACSRGARKVCLRVLSTNPAAQSLYRSAGFTVEGVLVGEFFLNGSYVDDVLMARNAGAPEQDAPALPSAESRAGRQTATRARDQSRKRPPRVAP